MRVLMVSPHFPPDTSAGTHRVRLLAPHLGACGWTPTVLSVDPRDLEERTEPGLLDLVPRDLHVVRCRALPARHTRRLGLGDLGLRALPGLWRAAAGLLGRERYDALYITTYPTYPALLGPALKRRFGVPFVLDLQDPWVGAWGRSVGGGPGGRADLKSRLSRALAIRLEPRAARAADAVTTVSQGTWDEVVARHPDLAARPAAAIPIGFEPGDFDRVGARRAPFDPADGDCHLCAVGTLLPNALATLRALLAAAALLRARRPDLYGRLRLRFFGTSNRREADAPERALPLARELGVADRVREVAPRLDFLDALAVQREASALLLLGSTEPHYTASRLYPALGARRPLLAIYRAESSVVEVLGRVARPPSARLVTFGANGPDAEAIYPALAALVERPAWRAEEVDAGAVAAYTARALAEKLAAVLERVRR